MPHALASRSFELFSLCLGTLRSCLPPSTASAPASRLKGLQFLSISGRRARPKSIGPQKVEAARVVSGTSYREAGKARMRHVFCPQSWLCDPPLRAPCVLVMSLRNACTCANRQMYTGGFNCDLWHDGGLALVDVCHSSAQDVVLVWLAGLVLPGYIFR